MDNKKRGPSLLLYLAIPIILIIIAAIFLTTRQTETPKTSELVQYFADHKVESYTINYGSGAIEITLKEGETAYPKDEDSKDSNSGNPISSAISSNITTNSDENVVVKGQLADIQRFLDTIEPYQKDEDGKTIPYNLVRASQGNELWQGKDQKQQR